MEFNRYTRDILFKNKIYFDCLSSYYYKQTPHIATIFLSSGLPSFRYYLYYFSPSFIGYHFYMYTYIKTHKYNLANQFNITHMYKLLRLNTSYLKTNYCGHP